MNHASNYGFSILPSTREPIEPTVEGLKSWLEKQDPSWKYNFEDPNGCLLCRYLGSLGYYDPQVVPSHWRAKGQAWVPLRKGLNIISRGLARSGTAGMEGWTYGKALERSQAWLAGNLREEDDDSD